ncbi:hypothetical protein KY359_06835 [Candidatus Woesearchaeota archaeon]|nr:hypothetical protein [Candidatus Woesearchaeota archaeon]
MTHPAPHHGPVAAPLHVHHAHHRPQKKKSISDRVAEEAIDEIMMAGLAFLLVVAGVNYFNMKWSWAKILAGAATGSEVGEMLSALAQTFPFKYLFVQYDFWGALIVAVCLTVLGLSLKAFTVRTKGKFIIDIGKNIYVPAVVGLVVILVLQLWTAFNVNEYLSSQSIAHPEFSSGYFIWETYGQLFLLGAALLVCGAIVKLVGEKNTSRKTIMIGDTLFNGAFILIIYYFIIRMLALDVVLYSDIGDIVRLFIISTQYSGFTITICVFMFTFGRALKSYGVHVLKHERRMHQIEEFKRHYEHMKEEFGAHPAREHPPHPKELQVSTQGHLRHPGEPKSSTYPVHSHPRYEELQPYRRKVR